MGMGRGWGKNLQEWDGDGKILVGMGSGRRQFILPCHSLAEMEASLKYKPDLYFEPGR